MLFRSVVIVELLLIIAVDDQSQGARLFPEDADRAVQGRPGRTISGIERIVDLASGVGEPELIEPLALPCPELAEPLALPGRDELEDGVGGRVKIILAIGAHLVGIDRDMRLPLQERVIYNKEVQTMPVETEVPHDYEEQLRQRIYRERDVEADRIARDKALEEESVKLEQEIEQEIRGTYSILNLL